MNVGLIVHGSVEGIEEKDVERIGFLDEREVGVDVRRHGWQLEGSDGRGLVLFEGSDGLGSGVFGDFEVFFAETGNGFAFAVGDDDVFDDLAGFGLEGGNFRGVWGGGLGVESEGEDREKN
jgi:hypothetical protein